VSSQAACDCFKDNGKRETSWTYDVGLRRRVSPPGSFLASLDAQVKCRHVWYFSQAGSGPRRFPARRWPAECCATWKALTFAPLMLGLAAVPAAARKLTLDPHLDLPKPATAPGWTGLADLTPRFDLEQAKLGGVNAAAVALFVPHTQAQAVLRPGDRDPRDRRS
jgi:hypothetical protein